MKKNVEKILYLAKIAYENDNIPVGAIIVKNNKVIGCGYNTKNTSGLVIEHAEINAINEANKFIGDWRLDDCIMYVTLLPCMMCAGAILESRIKKVYYLCDRTNVCLDYSQYLNIEKIVDEKNEIKYMKLLQSFFENKRNK